MASFDAMVAKVQALMDRADHPATPPEEAESARNMAEKIMLKYAIEEGALNTARGDSKVKPVADTFKYCDAYSSFLTEYHTLMYYVCTHKGVRVNTNWGGTATLVGFESDIALVKMIYLSVRLHLSSRVEAQPDQSLTFDQNVRMLKEAGWKWERIGRALDCWPDGGKLIRAYKRQCKADGVAEHIKSSPEVYLRSFTEGYLNTIWTRLREMRRANSDIAESGTGAVVLRDRKADVDEAFYEMFPHFRPQPVSPAAKEDEARCERCAKAKSGYCREHRPRSYRSYERAYDASAKERGARVAATADLSGGVNGLRTHAGEIG